MTGHTGRGARLALLGALVFAPPARSQSTVPLGKADATVPEPFSLVRGVRELADGRLLLTDWIEQRLVIADFATASVADRGRIGAGPTEFRLPGALLPFRSDSSILVDVGNGRLAVLDPHGRIARTMQSKNPSANSPSGGDAAGRLYFIVYAWNAPRPLAGDTVELGRLDLATDRAEMIARIHGITLAPPASSPSDGPRVPMVVFAQQDAWAVSSTGRLAIVRGADYSIELHDSARIVRGASNAFSPVRVSDADRKAFVREFLQNSPMSGRGPDGGLGHTPSELLSDANVDAMVRRSHFAEVLPFFRAGDVRFDGAGRLWVGRTTRADEPHRYDVFDAAAVRVGSVLLPPGRRLVTLGRRHAYLVATDADGLETLERYPLPALDGASGTKEDGS